jgi:mannose-6-phosphate isomerase-like protein (cupin superfamily)
MALEKTEFGLVEILKRDKDASFTLETIFPGKSVPKHYHKEGDEIMVVTEGNTNELKEGQIYLFRKNQPHGFVNNSDKPLKLLLIMAPPYDKKDYFTQ